MDVPYLESNHKQIRDEIARIDEVIKELDEKLDETVKSFKPINPIFKTTDPNRTIMRLITKDKEI